MNNKTLSPNLKRSSLKKSKGLLLSTVLFVFVPLFTMGGCSYPPTAFISDVNFVIAIYSHPVNYTSIDLPVTGYGTSTAYRYAIGSSSLNCTDSNVYSSWRPYTTRLQANISNLSEGPAKICLLARKEDPEIPSGFAVQSPFYASVYNFTIDRTPPSAPQISSPASTIINDNTPTIQWIASPDEARCSLVVSSTPDCSTTTQSYELNTNSQDLAPLSDGMHYICLKAFDAAGNEALASEYPKQINVDTTPPGDFSITRPTPGSSLNVTIGWTAASDASTYNVILASDSNCSSNIIQQFSGLTTLTQSASVPALGTYYVCAQALDALGNVKSASNSGYSFTIGQPQERIVKDHVTDNSCWNTTNTALVHYNAPNDKDAIVAARFSGLGGIINRVGGIFIDSSCTAFNNGNIQNMQASVAFYENINVFMTDPYLRNQPPGSRSMRVSVPILHTDQADPKYYLNPVRTTAAGTQEFFIEADVSALNIQTTEGQEHLVALWFSSDNALDGATWMAFSNGCAGQVGSLSDYYSSHAGQTALGPNALSNLNANKNNAAYFVSEFK
jgi:hypothetical protein